MGDERSTVYCKVCLRLVHTTYDKRSTNHSHHHHHHRSTMEYLRGQEIPLETHELPLVSQLQQELKDHLTTKKSVSSRAKTAIENVIQDESLLCKYIRVRKNDVGDARKWILRNIKAESDLYPELSHPGKLTHRIRRMLTSGIFTLLRYADPSGGPIVVFDIGAWDPAVHPLDDMIATCKYISKRAVDSTNCFEVGGTAIVIGSGTSLSHVKLCTIPTLKKVINIFHQTQPIPTGSLYFVNAPRFVYPVYRFFKPLLPAKFKEHIVISSGLEELHEVIPRKILPKRLGGEMDDDDDATTYCLELDEQFRLRTEEFDEGEPQKFASTIN